jgi:boron transporter
VHTDSLTIYETRLKRIATEEGEGAEIRKPIVEATAVVEQRVSHFLMGLALIGTMTGPLLKVLGTMPRAIFAGVFFVVGVSHLIFLPHHHHGLQPNTDSNCDIV